MRIYILGYISSDMICNLSFSFSVHAFKRHMTCILPLQFLLACISVAQAKVSTNMNNFSHVQVAL